jgi:hypothetical protein
VAAMAAALSFFSKRPGLMKSWYPK